MPSQDWPVPRLSSRLRASAARGFVGRASELSLFRSCIRNSSGSSDAYRVLYLHGVGGVGKTTLLRRYEDEAWAAGRQVMRIDCRTIAASPAAFLAHAAPALRDPRAVLLIDTFERCQGLEAWLRDEFLPQLPEGALAVLAGRRRPDPMWQADPRWRGTLKVVDLRDLSGEEASALLTAQGVPPSLHPSVVALAGGHPLALCLAATVADGRPGAAAPSWEPAHDVVGTLLAQLVGDVPSAVHRSVLEICAHALFTTEGLLRAALPGHDSGALFAWLRELPFVEAGPFGLFPHDVVREALDADLRWRDPQGYRDMHHRVRQHLVDRAHEAEGPHVLPAISALTHLHRRNGFLSRYLTWRDDGEIYEDGVRPDDTSAVTELAHACAGPETAAITDFWIRRRREAFRVCRRSDTGELVAVLTFLRLAQEDEEENAADPVTAAAWNDARSTAPPRPREHLLIARVITRQEFSTGASPVMDFFLHRMVSEFIHVRGLARSYVVLPENAFWEPLMGYIDQHLLPTRECVDNSPYSVFAHDWRIVPAERWLEFSRKVEISGPRRSRLKPGNAPAMISRPDFDGHIRRALQSLNRADDLSANPLARSELVRDAATDDPAEALRTIMTRTIHSLREDPQAMKLHRAVEMTFLRGAPTRETAAERLGLPLSTYRRHLTAGVQRVGDLLWHRLHQKRPDINDAVGSRPHP
ncbi:ATP-binding protein [Streptomyces sp. 8N706]|uniref:ATP-binding protein n=1 Tax=Streptomyces sp. 8N706 TaxID=3457416 RepID=UPI003FD15BCB